MLRRFKLTRDYESERDGIQYGPWLAGQQVELTADEAEWIESDSPGAIQDLGRHAGERIGDDPKAKTERGSSPTTRPIKI